MLTAGGYGRMWKWQQQSLRNQRKLLGNIDLWKKHVQRPTGELDPEGSMAGLQIVNIKDGHVFEGPWGQARGSGLFGESSEEPWNTQVNTFPLNEHYRLWSISQSNLGPKCNKNTMTRPNVVIPFATMWSGSPCPLPLGLRGPSNKGTHVTAWKQISKTLPDWDTPFLGEKLNGNSKMTLLSFVWIQLISCSIKPSPRFWKQRFKLPLPIHWNHWYFGLVWRQTSSCLQSNLGLPLASKLGIGKISFLRYWSSGLRCVQITFIVKNVWGTWLISQPWALDVRRWLRGHDFFPCVIVHIVSSWLGSRAQLFGQTLLMFG